VLNSREGNWGKQRKREKKGKSHAKQIAVLGIALRQGNRFATACKAAKVEETLATENGPKVCERTEQRRRKKRNC
jgi:hypothetical protein